ncbi:MAG: CoA transferase [Marmoricola sp.]|jgi:CoA:oxalate CoA-transferase|nr:CoA transferase [Marmoricola sp.]
MTDKDNSIWSSPVEGPLNGVKIVDMSWHLAGPFCTLILADLGASVIKVEATGSNGGYDPGGFTRHYYKDQDAHYMALNRNKRSMTLNLKTERGKELFNELVSGADVVFNNFRAGVMPRLGVGFEDLRKVNPSLIFASLTSFGQTGPYSKRPGVDLVVQALSGGMSMTGEPGRSPVRAGIPLGDLAGGMWAAISILSAIQGRNAGTTEATEIDLSLLDGQIAMIPYFSAYYFLDGAIPGPQGSGGHSPTYGAFKCSDDRYVIIAVTDQIPWGKLCRALDRTDLQHLPKFEDSRQRAGNGVELHQIVEDEFAKRPSEEWCRRLEEADLGYARVNSLDEALADPQVLHRDMVIEIEHTLGDKLKFVGNPVKMTGFNQTYSSPPIIGEHTEAVLQGLGLDADEFAELRTSGVV